MIIKPHEMNIYSLKLEALGRRTEDYHREKSKIQDEIVKNKSGIKGEREISYPLSFLTPEDYLILHNLRVPSLQSHFEIDTLIPSRNYLLIVEVKNWYGTLYFDGENQVIRVGDDGKEEGLPNPIPQVELQRHRLRLWLNQQNFPQIPLLYFVVYSSPSTIIKPLSSNNPVPKEVIHSNLLFHKIKELNRQFRDPIFDMDMLQQLSSKLLADHTPYDTNVLNNFSVKRSELIKGVFCPQCSSVPMERLNRKWHCRHCNHFSANAHIPALNDYYLLFGENIRNREAREFLMVDSPEVMKNLLLNSGYSYTGNTKSRSYRLELK
ncbi:nuclease-related domain-containing protein [Virgibacillus sp. JSM 102003]|uniref:nuclease-related domain-containing protein n=1 Tax=Virgibacillus sp. JSM 102003 TaxID=1562108 RepID=UPI0035C13E2C